MSETVALRLIRSSSAPSMLTRVRQSLRALRSVWTGPISSKDPALARLFGSGYESAAGVVVTHENAFTFSAVFDAVNQISSDVAKLPLNLLKKRKEGGTDHYEASRLYWLLKHEPNPEMSSMVFRRTILAHALTCHGGYAEIERNATGEVIALWILTPDRVQPYRDRLTSGRMGPLQYLIDGKTLLAGRDVLHIQGLGYDGTSAYSVIDKARQTIGLALAAERFGAQYFGKGTIFGGWLETEDDLDETQKAEIRDAINEFRSKQDAAFRILVTGTGHKFHQFPNKPSESQMDELRVTQVLEVARFFRMPPHRLGVNTPGTVSYASVEAANLDYYTGPILDWITLFEQEGNRKLIPALERRSQFIKHNANAFLRGTIRDRYEALGIARDKGIISANDWRELEDMNPQDGEQGNEYLVQAAQIPLRLLAAQVEAQIDKTKADAKPDPTPSGDSEDAIRAAAAEAALVEARSALAEARERLVAAEIAGTATAEELEQLQTAVGAQSAQLRNLEILTGEARAAAAAAQQAAGDALEIERGARASAEAAIVERQAQVDTAKVLLMEAEQARDEALAALTAAQQECERLGGEATEAHQVVADLTASHEATVADREAALQLAEQATAAQTVAEGIAATRERSIAALEAELAEIRVVAEQTQADLLADREALASARTSEAAALLNQQEAEALRVEANQQLAEAEAERQAAIEAREMAEQARAAAEAERQALLAREAARAAAVVPAHRAVLVEAVRRITAREVTQAKRAQATPEKLRRWLGTVGDHEAALYADILTPAVRAHVAHLTGTDDTALVEARVATLIEAHLAALRTQIGVALDADPNDFHAVLDRVLSRWEDRPSQVADQLLGEEITHGRRI